MIQYAVVQLNGYHGAVANIKSLMELKGEPVEPDETLYDKMRAENVAKLSNSGLNSTEKNYYEIEFVVAEIVMGKYTCK